MFIVTMDFKGALPERNTKDFLKGLREAAFGAIPAVTRAQNELNIDADCIAIHLDLNPVSLVGRAMRLIRSGNFPDFLALICFSAKPQYIPHEPELVAAISIAATEFMTTGGWLESGTKNAAWAIPFPFGKWTPNTAI